VALLGEGGFGRVYRGIDPGLNREVAIKVPLRLGLTTETRERFLREAHTSANIHHPNVCPIYDVGIYADLPYLVMRFVPGGTLAELLARRKTRLPARFAAAIARKLALGVAAAHEIGVVHRDLKPQNVLWDAVRKQVLITDFGLARFEGGSVQTPDGQVVGTPAYMAPEQATGENSQVGPLADVYSLGVIMYELLAARPPYQGTVFEVLWKVTQEPPLPPSTFHPGLDTRLESICLQAMARSPMDRFGSAAALADALGAYLKEELGTSGDDGLPDSPEPDEALPWAAPNSPPASGLGISPSDPVLSREVLVCPSCGARLEVSVGRAAQVECPRCKTRFPPEMGREAAIRVARGTMVTNRARATAGSGHFEPDHPPSARYGPNWTPAICGVLLSWIGLLLTMPSGCVVVALTLITRYRTTIITHEPAPNPLSGAGEPIPVPTAVWLALVGGMILTVAGRWWSARVPRRVGGAIAARLAALLTAAAAGCICYGVVIDTTRDSFQLPTPGGIGSRGTIAVGILLVSEVVYTYYFAVVGRQLVPGFSRRSVKGLRRTLSCLICLLACGVYVLQYISHPDRSGELTTALAASAGVLAVLIAVVLGVSAYRTLSVHVRAMVEMWHDAKGEGG